MIAIDSSALIAILLNEPERDVYFDRIADASARLVSAVSVLESGIVMHARLRQDGIANLFDFLSFIEAQLVPFDEPETRTALDAFTRYGKGIHSRARLNMGDCASYALAKSRNIPLLFKGEDFKATDIVAAV